METKTHIQKTPVQNLIRKKEHLVLKFLADAASDFLGDLTRILDEYVFTVYEKSITARKMVIAGKPFAVIALGGYGRKEQCIHSDIDLLILFDEAVPPEVEAFVQEIVYPLWDARFEVGYSVRFVDECVDMAFERFDILTTVLDARFICGNSLIYSRFKEKFRHLLSTRFYKQTLDYLFEHGIKRLENFGDSTFLVTPDLKSGFGGLRDYHTLLWYAKIKSDIKERRDLEYYGFLSHFEYHTLGKTLNYIWRIRNWLHHITCRKCDTLHFEYQTEMADRLNYKNQGGRADVEIFLGDLHARMDFLKQINQITFEDIMTSSRIRKEAVTPRLTKTSGLVIRKRRLYFANTVVILQHPELLFKIFLESGRRRIPLSIEARRVVSEFLHLVDTDIRKDPANIKIFKQILALSFWEFNVLNVMLSTGILERIIPEYKAIRNKIQYNHYHLFPVDKHSIRCVQVINSFREPGTDVNTSLYANVYKEIRNKTLLRVSALLHDIGKSDPAKEHSNTGAEIARPIFERLEFRSTETADAQFLIRNHLLLAKTATRRDVFDEETAVYTANKVGKIRLLRMLFLLTVADSMATGPKAWNEWTENLIKDLFLKTMRILKTGELASRKAQRLIQRKKEEVTALLGDIWQETDTAKQLDALSKRYLLNMPAIHIANHIKLYQNLGNQQFIWQISQEDDSDIRTVSICGRDKPGFYSKIAGVFFLNRINIVASQAYPLGDTHILDIFKVMAPSDRIFEKEKWEKTEQDLTQALLDDHFLDKVVDKIPTDITIASGRQPEPNQVRIDNDTSSFFTIIEVLTYDFAGLLFTITNTLYRCGTNVNVAMVGSKVDQIMDIFYVRSLEDDQKIQDPAKLKQIKTAILERLPQLHAKEV
ncbi:MAG: [protein-PII] uridylyltransferase [Desulfotignum sp.]|nr:[protein-PII] uridylyltransferase [Desulfotignum sp.]